MGSFEMRAEGQRVAILGGASRGKWCGRFPENFSPRPLSGDLFPRKAIRLFVPSAGNTCSLWRWIGAGRGAR
jgi:hypothetical protein